MLLEKVPWCTTNSNQGPITTITITSIITSIITIITSTITIITTKVLEPDDQERPGAAESIGRLVGLCTK